MSVIEKLQKISAEMFKQMLKTYQFKDLIVHKRAQALNAVEYCALYPNKGVGFHIRRKTWPKGMYLSLKQAQYKSNRFGHFSGIKIDQNGPVDQFPKRLQGLNKRGVWQYDLGDFKSFTTDNGVTYNRADYQAYYQLRKPKQTQIEEVAAIQESAEQEPRDHSVGFSKRSN